jgi:hypothetical protein
MNFVSGNEKIFKKPRIIFSTISFAVGFIRRVMNSQSINGFSHIDYIGQSPNYSFFWAKANLVSVYFNPLAKAKRQRIVYKKSAYN